MTALACEPTTRFRRPADLTAAEPPEHRGLSRDGVRLLVARGSEPTGIQITHSRFSRLGDQLDPGDLVVVNNSQTLAGEVTGIREGGESIVLHVATPLTDGSWIVELRTAPDGTSALLDARRDEMIRLAHDARVRLLQSYPEPGASPATRDNRLWRAEIHSETPLPNYLARYGRPISYGYLSQHWPLADYQTVFGSEPGSAEMPSAGRPFTPELVTELVSAGVLIAPITLHTGLSSQETGEAPQPERFTVPAATARLVNVTRAGGGRVVAVGTTVTRALESAAEDDGLLAARSGWTDLVIGPEHPARVVRGLITGLHDPDASHLLLVESVAGAELTQRAYDEAVAERYLWHEFGDSCLLLPG